MKLLSLLFSFLSYWVAFGNHEEGHEVETPSIPTKYYTTIEANIGNKGYSYVLEEWYDAEAQRARRTFHWNNYVFTFWEDWSSEVDAVWIYLSSADDLDTPTWCDVESYSNKSHSTAWSRTLTVFGQWMQNGEMDNAEYMGIYGDLDDDGEECGDYNMRGMEARRWDKNSTYNSTDDDTGDYTQINMTTSYFWISPNWTYSTRSNNNETEVPFRIEIIGHHTTINGTDDSISKDYDFYHSYEYVSFFRGDNSFDNDEYLDFYTNMPDWVDECDTTHYCSFYPDSDLCTESRGPEFPQISDQFQLFMDINDKINNVTYGLYEYYDYPNDRVRLSFYYSDDYKDSFHQLQLDSIQQKWVWVGDETGDDMSFCDMSTVENITGIDLFVDEVRGHISRPSKWFHSEQNRTWMGYTTIREGVLAEKWKAVWIQEYPCCNNEYYITINASSYFYFTRKEWNITYSNWDDVVPLRLELDGYYEIYNITSTDGSTDEKTLMSKNNLDMSYEMTAFANGLIDDSNFELPTNWRSDCEIDENYCSNTKYQNTEVCSSEPELPVLPDAFEATVECVFVTKNFSIIVDEFYDYESNREKVVIYPYTFISTVYGWSIDVPYSTHMLEDGDIFWKWQLSSGDSICGECDEVEECELMIVDQAQGQGISTWFDTDSRHVSTTKKLFDWVANNSVVTYMGSHNVRGIPCNQWKHDVQVWESTFESYGTTYDYRSNFTVTYSFMQDYYKSEEIYGNYGIPVRADVKGYTTISSDTGFSTDHSFEHFYNYIKFYPRTPDERWFEPPSGEEVTCNITKYCDAAESFNGVSSSSDEGESSEEYQDWCDEAVDGLIGVFDSSDEEINKVVNKETNTAGIWIVAVLMCILTAIGGYFFGQYRAKADTSKVRLGDEHDPHL